MRTKKYETKFTLAIKKNIHENDRVRRENPIPKSEAKLIKISIRSFLWRQGTNDDRLAYLFSTFDHFENQENGIDEQF